jgi:hypothetical protein
MTRGGEGRGGEGWTVVEEEEEECKAQFLNSLLCSGFILYIHYGTDF